MATLHPKSLSVAVALADIGSATEAARLLRISQPGVTYHIGRLERALGTKLFRRTSAGLVPTAEGEILVDRARAVLAALEGIARDVRSSALGHDHTVRVSSACFTNYHWLPDVLKQFRRDHGNVKVELDVDPSRRPFEALDDGRLDVALTTVPPEGSRFTLLELFDDEVVAILSPEHPLAGRKRLDPVDFANQSVAVFDRSQSDLFNLALAPEGIAPREVTDVPVTEALLGLVRAGLAISAMASWVAQPDLREGRLVAIRIGRKGIRRTWWAVLSKGRPARPVVTHFVEALRGAGTGVLPSAFEGD